MAQTISDCTKLTNDLEKQLTLFQRKIYRVVSYNEVGDPGNIKNAYSLSLANDGQPKNASGYSFGWTQWDLHKQGEKSPSGIILGDALKNIRNEALKERAQARGITQVDTTSLDNIDDLKKALSKKIAATTGKSDPIVSAFKDFIDAELGKMSSRIDAESVESIKRLEGVVSTTISRVTNRASRRFVETSEVAQLFIADVENQYGGGKTKSLVNFLNNGETTIFEKRTIGDKSQYFPTAMVTTSGAEFGIEELLTFSLSTDYGSAHPYDVLRRFANIVKVVAVENVFLTQEDAQYLADGLPESLWPRDAYGMALGHKDFQALVLKAWRTIGKVPPALQVAKPRTNKKKIGQKADTALKHPHAAETAAWYQQDYYSTKHWNIASRLYHLHPHDDSPDGWKG